MAHILGPRFNFSTNNYLFLIHDAVDALKDIRRDNLVGDHTLARLDRRLISRSNGRFNRIRLVAPMRRNPTTHLVPCTRHTLLPVRVAGCVGVCNIVVKDVDRVDTITACC